MSQPQQETLHLLADTDMAHAAVGAKREPGRCPAGHILQTYAMPKDSGGCAGCGRNIVLPGMLTRGCRKCNFDLCEEVTTTPTMCPEQCAFGPPFSGTIAFQGPALSFKYSAENLLLDDEHVWLGPNHESSWFIMDIGNCHRVCGFELRNVAAHDDKSLTYGNLHVRRGVTSRCTVSCTIETSRDGERWRRAATGDLKNTAELMQIATSRPLSDVRYIKFTYDSFDGPGGGLRYFAPLSFPADPPLSYVISPVPPLYLWDSADSKFLDFVKCHAVIRVVSLDPKSGAFQLRIKCHWSFRTLNSLEDSEIRLRGVPGLRIPALSMSVEESRVWKDLSQGKSLGSKTTQKSVYWKGTTTLTLDGYKSFHVETFPFDRQIINLEQVHFVWRPRHDDADYFKSMKVVSFTAETYSMMAEWSPQLSYIIPIAKHVCTPKDSNDPSYASKFIVKVRIERQHLFYIWQVFFPAYLMTLVSCTPLAMPPSEDDMGERLSVYGSGLLTLVAFKYGVADHLPSVPYPTFIDNYLKFQLITVSMCAFESIISFQIVIGGKGTIMDTDMEGTQVFSSIDLMENFMFVLIFLVWSAWFLIACFYMPYRKPDWRDIWAQKNQNTVDADYFEMHDPEDYDFQPTGRCGSFGKGTKLVNSMDNLAIWDLQSGDCVGRLKAREVVEAAGPATSSESILRRFDPQDSQLCTLQELCQKRRRLGETARESEHYWQTQCKARMLLPIHLPDCQAAVAVDREHLRNDDAIAVQQQTMRKRVQRKFSDMSESYFHKTVFF
eukprot:TRINITY_DN55268_c0_g1_i1.p1 TRINITY_DN55268_c0_g1~~TRINITY_DN55268_c0_g1_i1.p1  ORF type:complete len:778 (+),score=111.40 TRINITY_DN55268_c0_g1_i1:124-2457(+)